MYLLGPGASVSYPPGLNITVLYPRTLNNSTTFPSGFAGSVSYPPGLNVTVSYVAALNTSALYPPGLNITVSHPIGQNNPYVLNTAATNPSDPGNTVLRTTVVKITLSFTSGLLITVYYSPRLKIKVAFTPELNITVSYTTGLNIVVAFTPRLNVTVSSTSGRNFTVSSNPGRDIVVSETPDHNITVSSEPVLNITLSETPRFNTTGSNATLLKAPEFNITGSNTTGHNITMRQPDINNATPSPSGVSGTASVQHERDINASHTTAVDDTRSYPLPHHNISVTFNSTKLPSLAVNNTSSYANGVNTTTTSPARPNNITTTTSNRRYSSQHTPLSITPRSNNVTPTRHKQNKSKSFRPTDWRHDPSANPPFGYDSTIETPIPHTDEIRYQPATTDNTLRVSTRKRKIQEDSTRLDTPVELAMKSLDSSSSRPESGSAVDGAISPRVSASTPTPDVNAARSTAATTDNVSGTSTTRKVIPSTRRSPTSKDVLPVPGKGFPAVGIFQLNSGEPSPTPKTDHPVPSNRTEPAAPQTTRRSSYEYHLMPDNSPGGSKVLSVCVYSRPMF